MCLYIYRHCLWSSCEHFVKHLAFSSCEHFIEHLVFKILQRWEEELEMQKQSLTCHLASAFTPLMKSLLCITFAGSPLANVCLFLLSLRLIFISLTLGISPNGSRPNRAAGRGYWKATGADKPVCPKGSSKALGIKKALVFYHGKAPKGLKTDWIMHEYRLADVDRAPNKKGTLRLDDWVLCRLYNKKNNWEKTERKVRREERSSVMETMEYSEIHDETGSTSHRTPESEIDNDSFPEIDELVQAGFFPADQVFDEKPQPVRSGFPVLEKMKEENDWMSDFNLDDFQSSWAAFGAATAVDVQDSWFSALVSPRLRPQNQVNFSRF